MIEYFNYEELEQINRNFTPGFFVSFMILFDHFMKNMFIAIIVAHYREF